MKYRRVGRSGVKVSTVGLGSWLTFGHRVSQEGTNACVRAALDAGINFIDTADVYALGASEEALGHALADVPRRDVFLASKVFFPTGQGPNDQGLSRKHVRESLDASLARLRTDYLDLYQCHRYDPDTPLEEVVRTMDDLIRAGRILYWGVSLWRPEQIVDAVKIAKAMGAELPVSNQPRYNMLQREIEDEVLPVSERYGIGQVVYSPLAQGLLTGKYEKGRIPADSRAADERSNQFLVPHLTEENIARVERIAAVAADRGLSMPQLALAWCLREPGVSSVITGAKSPAQLTENAGAADIELDEALLAELDEILRG